MELVFNELSIQPHATNPFEADQLVGQLIKTYAEGKKHNFKKIRFHVLLSEIFLLTGYSLEDWLRTTSNKTYKNLLLAAKVYPFIREEDDWAEHEYLSHRYSFENDFISKSEPQGLAAAIIYETLSISLNTHEFWRNIELSVIINDGTNEGNQVLFNVCTEDSFDHPSIWNYIGSITKPILVTTDIPPFNKLIKLRDDHGKDILMNFGKRILNSEYVVSVINSLPFNPKASKLIREIYPDGTIELVLYWEDKGYGMLVKTTGRNIHETKLIASILVEKFDH